MRTELIQALHAGISRRDWHATERAANAIRDSALSPTPTLKQTGSVVAWERTEVPIYDNVPPRRDVTLDPELAEMWRNHPFTQSMRPLYASEPITAREVTDWQDIETAPRDGTPFLISRNGAVFRARWFGGLTISADGYQIGWELSDVDGWQPLPPALLASLNTSGDEL